MILFIPWFRAEPWNIPLPFRLPLFDVDHIPIQPFGILVAIGVVVGSRIAEWYGTKRGLHPGLVADFVTHVVVTGFLCGYFLNAAFYEPEVFLQIFSDPGVLFRKYLGLSSYGGFLGAILGIVIWKIRRKQSVWLPSDATSIGFVAGWFFGRMGCFVVHDHPGKVTDFPLAVADYQAGEPPFLPRHDLGLYEVIWSALVFGWFMWLQRKPRAPGFFAALLPLTYTPVRFLLDYLRATPDEGGDIRYFGLTPGHYWSVALFGFGLWLLYQSRLQGRLAAQTASSPAQAKNTGKASIKA